MRHLLTSNVTPLGRLASALPVIVALGWIGVRLAELVSSIPLPH